jgi:hypothetical protein
MSSYRYQSTQSKKHSLSPPDTALSDFMEGKTKMKRSQKAYTYQVKVWNSQWSSSESEKNESNSVLDSDSAKD